MDQEYKKELKKIGKIVLSILGVLVVIGIIGNMIDSDKSNTSSPKTPIQSGGAQCGIFTRLPYEDDFLSDVTLVL